MRFPSLPLGHPLGFPLVAGVLVCTLLQGCSRARDLFTDDWNEYENRVTPQIQPLREKLSGIEKRLKDLDAQKSKHPLITPFREKMDSALGGFANDIRTIDSLIDNEKRDLNALLDRGKLEEGKTSFSEFKARLDATIVTARASAEVAQKELTDFSDRIEHRERALKGFAMKKGKADFRSIEFKARRGELDLSSPLSEVTMGELVKFAKTCPELRFEIAGHSGREGPPEERERISLARANTVKNYLYRKGVPKEVIEDTTGKGYSHPLVREPETNSNEEKNMDEAKLKAIRAQNRRVDIIVTEPCPPPPATTDAATGTAPGAVSGAVSGAVTGTAAPDAAAGAPTSASAESAEANGSSNAPKTDTPKGDAARTNVPATAPTPAPASSGASSPPSGAPPSAEAPKK